MNIELALLQIQAVAIITILAGIMLLSGTHTDKSLRRAKRLTIATAMAAAITVGLILFTVFR